MEVRFTILGVPVGKGRPRVYRTASGHAHAVTPEKTILYENLVKVSYQQTSQHRFSGSVKVEIHAFFDIPKSATKKRRAEIQADHDYYHGKPDTDNIAKSICDALNGVAWDDDKDVVELLVRKSYDSPARVEVIIRGE